MCSVELGENVPWQIKENQAVCVLRWVIVFSHTFTGTLKKTIHMLPFPPRFPDLLHKTRIKASQWAIKPTKKEESSPHTENSCSKWILIININNINNKSILITTFRPTGLHLAQDFTPPFSFKLLSCPAPEPDLGVWDVHTCLVFLTLQQLNQLR